MFEVTQGDQVKNLSYRNWWVMRERKWKYILQTSCLCALCVSNWSSTDHTTNTWFHLTLKCMLVCILNQKILLYVCVYVIFACSIIVVKYRELSNSMFFIQINLLINAYKLWFKVLTYNIWCYNNSHAISWVVVLFPVWLFMCCCSFVVI